VANPSPHQRLLRASTLVHGRGKSWAIETAAKVIMNSGKETRPVQRAANCQLYSMFVPFKNPKNNVISPRENPIHIGQGLSITFSRYLDSML